MGIIKLGGLISGMDTDAVIAKILEAESQPILLTKKKQASAEKKQTVWKEILTKLKTFNSAVDDLKAGEASFTTVKATSTDDTVVKATGGAGGTPGVYNISVTNLAYAHSVMTDAKADTGALGVTGSFTMSMQVSDTETRTVTVTLDGTENIGQIQSKIQNAKDVDNNKLPVTVSLLNIDDSNARLIITANDTGADSEITFADVAAGTALSQLGIPTTMPGAPAGNTLQVAKDATFLVENLTLTRGSNSISDVVPGVTLTLLQEGASAKVTVNRDVDKVVTGVNNLVTQYNALVDYIAEQSKYDDVTKKGGPLLGDSTGTRILSLLRRQVMDPVYTLPADWQQPAQMGLTGEALDTTDAASLKHLTLDASVLRAKMEENPQAVADLFDAVATRLSEDIDDYTKSGGLLEKKDQTFESEIKQARLRIEALEDRLDRREIALRRQFTGLEGALRRMQSQQAKLMSQLNGLTS